jgi:hypothetical protein
MESRALPLPVSGDARVVRLPGRDELARLCAIYDLISCRYAEVVPLAVGQRAPGAGPGDFCVSCPPPLHRDDAGVPSSSRAVGP